MLKEQLMSDLKVAMKEKNVIAKNSIQMTRAAILQVEKDHKVELDDQGVIEILAKEVKKRRDVLPEYQKSGRQDLIDELETEIKILAAYLPEQLSTQEIETIVAEAISQTGASSMKEIGKVMGVVMPKTKGRADGKIINEIAKRLLS